MCTKRFTQLSQLKSHRRTHQSKMIKQVGFQETGLRQEFQEENQKAEKRGRPKGAVYGHKKYTAKLKPNPSPAYQDTRPREQRRISLESGANSHLEFPSQVNTIPRI